MLEWVPFIGCGITVLNQRRKMYGPHRGDRWSSSSSPEQRTRGHGTTVL